MRTDVCMITYNHENYISEAIESVLRQQTSFAVRLIIGEDCSTDCTRQICEQYAKGYPDKIVLLTGNGNLGMMKNFVRTFEACNGDFIAFIEGDDYWTDEWKLQKQVDFLQDNPDYSLCFHNTHMKVQKSSEQRDWILHTKLEKDVFTTEDVLGPWFVPSCTSVFANYPDFVLPSWFYHCKYGDLPFMLLLSLKGKFKYIDEVMSVYRLHDSGMSTLHKAYDKVMLMIYIYESFNIHTNYKFQETIRQSVRYEIDRHIPPRIIDYKQPIENKKDILTRVYKKLTKSVKQVKTGSL